MVRLKVPRGVVLARECILASLRRTLEGTQLEVLAVYVLLKVVFARIDYAERVTPRKYRPTDYNCSPREQSPYGHIC